LHKRSVGTRRTRPRRHEVCFSRNLS
jgi:hypothetical protein